MKIIQIWALSILLLTMSSAQANRQLAVRNGCMGCHADAEYDAPPWPELAAKYAQYQGQADAASLQGEKLRKGKLFNHIKAHSKLSPANARDLMQWIIDGAQ
jgi:cytochrome c551/c552